MRPDDTVKRFKQSQSGAPTKPSQLPVVARDEQDFIPTPLVVRPVVVPLALRQELEDDDLD